MVKGTYRAVLRAGLFRHYSELRCLPAGHEGGLVHVTSLAIRSSRPEPAPPITAVIYLIDPRDPTSTYPESVALKRECVVNEVPFLSNADSARQWLSLHWWNTADENSRHYMLPEGLNNAIVQQHPTLSLSAQRIALIAHDKNKVALMRFVRDNWPLLSKFDGGIATGTTGQLLRGTWEPRLDRLPRDVKTALRSEVAKTRRALKGGSAFEHWLQPEHSGPAGGDVHIAHAVLKGECHKLLFFQDPHTSHEHEVDIQLLERTCRMPSTKVLCLHDKTSAMQWADQLQQSIDSGREAPMTIYEAFRLCFDAELVLAQPGIGATPTGLWKAIVHQAAHMVLGLLGRRFHRNSNARSTIHVGVAWGKVIQELITAVKGITHELHVLEQSLLIDHGLKLRGSSGLADFIGQNDVVAIPIVGTLGMIDPRWEANANARQMGLCFGGSSRSIPDCVLRHPEADTDPIRADIWNELDIAILTCGPLEVTYGERAIVWIPPDYFAALKERRVVGEVAGIPLDADGKQLEVPGYERVGVRVDQLRRLAESRSAVLIAGNDNRRVRPALSCLRGRLASVLVTDMEFAQHLLRAHLDLPETKPKRRAPTDLESKRVVPVGIA